MSSASSADSVYTHSTAESTAGSSLLSVLSSPNTLFRKRGNIGATWGHRMFDLNGQLHAPDLARETTEQSLSPVHRMRGESLSVSKKKLFCNSCRVSFAYILSFFLVLSDSSLKPYGITGQL